MPYGEDIASPPVANDRTKFATYHRDETGLDYADQRSYSPGTGRFLLVILIWLVGVRVRRGLGIGLLMLRVIR